MRHAAKESERLSHAVQDRLGAFGRQGDGERTIRPRPGRYQHRHLPTAFGKINVDVAEVALQTLTRIVVQGNEHFAALLGATAHIQADAL